MINKSIQLFVALSFGFIACKTAGPNNGEDIANENAIAAPASLQYNIVRILPHDTSSYTQGLEWTGDHLLESTGNYKESKLLLLDSNWKNSKTPIQLGAQYFGEGATQFKDKIYQLTWKEHKVFVYDAKTFKQIAEFYWPYEGWGMTHDDTSLIVSTGGSNIYYVNPIDFSVQKTVGVYNNFGYVSNINELEYVDGKIYANIYLTDNIIQINPSTGNVTAIADLTNLLSLAGVKNDPRTIDPGNVLNGIAYHKKRNTFFITGKDWPVLVEVKFN
jgi:glutamine cyclotransferase